MVDKCSAITRAGNQCRSKPLPGKTWCMSHDPALADKRREANRAGGAARSNARRAAKAWAAIGKEIGNEDLPAILRSCMVAVRDKSMEPNQANAIATLARTSVQITGDLELEARIQELEKAAGMVDTSRNIRRVS